MIIRKATTKDIPALVALMHEYDLVEHRLNPAIPMGLKKQYFTFFRKNLPKKRFAVFVADEGKLRGFIHTEVFRTNQKKKIILIGSIQNAVVNQKYRNRGIGSALLVTAVAWLKTHPIKRINAYVHGKNTKALTFWKNKWFRIRGYNLELSVKN
jgi:ribosomal protein S18 acetylase RimI-like enzyme